jgi:Flp pilus assembly protein TadD
VNKATDQEDTFPNRDARVSAIAIKTHEKPRDEKVSLKKPEVYKMLALVSSQNGNYTKAKKAIEEALAINPNDADLKTEGARIYFNEAYELLKDDQKLVDEINANLDNKAKYDELMEKRISVFKQALPSFEKAYSLNPTDANTKALLKMSYEILGMNDKAATIK